MKARNWLIAGLVIASLGALGGVIAPRLLMRAATEKPVAESTFVTRPAVAPDLRSQMNQALQHAPNNLNSQSVPGSSAPGQGISAPAGTDSAAQTTGLPTSGNTEQPASNAVISATQVPVQGQKPLNQSSSAVQSQTGDPSSPQQSQTTPSQPGAPGQFQLQIRENEIASLIYNGLYAGTAPEYRPSIQGVSVQLQGGKGRITVALLPKYLPEQFARNLPGVTKETPTIYLGGEVGLSLANNTVSPEIYSLSLGSLRIPAPFIKAMVKQQVQQHVRQMTQLESGQQAIFDSIDINNGAISIRGHVQ